MIQVKSVKPLTNTFPVLVKKTQSTISNDSETTGGLDCIKMVTYNRTLSFCKVSEQHLCKIISNTKPKTSSGSDGVSNVLLKKLAPVIKAPGEQIYGIWSVSRPDEIGKSSPTPQGW